MFVIEIPENWLDAFGLTAAEKQEARLRCERCSGPEAPIGDGLLVRVLTTFDDHSWKPPVEKPVTKHEATAPLASQLPESEKQGDETNGRS